MPDTNTKIRQLQNQVKELRSQISSLRAEMKPEPIPTDYEFSTAFRPKKLSELFGDKSTLIIVHNMGQKCPYCTLWLDTIEGFQHHLAQIAELYVASPDDGETQLKFKIGRDYHFPFVSTRDTTFTKDMGYETTDGQLVPGFSVFVKDQNGKVSRVSHDEFYPHDEYCGIWNILDHVPVANRGDWAPKISYADQNPKGIAGRVNFLLNYSKDFRSSVAFYEKYFGFVKEDDFSESSVYGNIGYTGMWIGEFSKENDPSFSAPRVAPMLEVKSARELFQRLKADGVKLHFDEPRNMGGRYWFQFTDPSGNVIEVLGG